MRVAAVIAHLIADKCGGLLLNRYGWISAALILVAPGRLYAQVRTIAFEQWAPPRIAAERSSGIRADSIQVRVGSHAGKGALIGAAVGGAVGLIAGIALGAGGSCSDCDSHNDALETGAIGGLVGAGAGGLIGLLFGLSSPKYEWRTSDGT